MSRSRAPRRLPFRPALAFAMLLILGACASVPPSAGPASDSVLVTFALPSSAPEPASGSRRVYHAAPSDGHWQVPLYTRQQVRAFARDHGLVQTGAWPIGALGVYCVAFTSANGTPAAELLPQLAADPRSELVQLNATFTGMTVTSAATDRRQPVYDDPLLDVQYGRFAARLSALHAISGGDAVRVGVIDTSADLSHPDLFGQVTKQVELVPAAEPAARLHGTAVTGVIAARGNNGEGLVGLAPRANVNVYGACTDKAAGALCTSFSIAQALADALEDRMQVINMSFAGPEDPLLAKLLDAAVAAGIVLVAAGNTDRPDARFPAGHPGVHAADGERHLWFASAERLSTRAGGEYQMFFGSSIASAGMSGLAALLRVHSSAVDTSAVLDWLFDGECDPATQPVALAPIRREQLCD